MIWYLHCRCNQETLHAECYTKVSCPQSQLASEQLELHPALASPESISAKAHQLFAWGIMCEQYWS